MTRPKCEKLSHEESERMRLLFNAVEESGQPLRASSKAANGQVEPGFSLEQHERVFAVRRRWLEQYQDGRRGPLLFVETTGEEVPL